MIIENIFLFIRKMLKNNQKPSLEKYSLKNEQIKEFKWIFQNVKLFTQIFLQEVKSLTTDLGCHEKSPKRRP